MPCGKDAHSGQINGSFHDTEGKLWFITEDSWPVYSELDDRHSAVRIGRRRPERKAIREAGKMGCVEKDEEINKRTQN